MIVSRQIVQALAYRPSRSMNYANRDLGQTDSRRSRRSHIFGSVLRKASALVLVASLSLPTGRVMAQEVQEPYRIGVLTAAWGPPGALSGLVDGLVALGYHENADFVVGVNFTQGDLSVLDDFASSMVESGVDLLFASGEHAAVALQQATSTHPIIFTAVGDPIELGLIASYARPGGNVTGVADLDLEVSGKRLQLFKELIPGLDRVMFLYNNRNNYDVSQAEQYRLAARRLDITLVERGVKSEEELRTALAELRDEEIEGVLSPSSVALNIPGIVLEFATREKLPSMYAKPLYVEHEGVAAYGGSEYGSGHQAAQLAHKILQGADPAELPVESVQRFEFVVNLKAANELGIRVPREILFQADRIVR